MGKRVGVFIDHDVIIRHFIKSEIFKEIEKDYKVIFIFPKNHRRVSVDLEKLNLREKYEVEIDQTRAYLIRMFYHASNVRKIIKKKSDEKIGEIKRYKKILGKKLFYFYYFILRFEIFFNIFKFFKKKKISNNKILDDIVKKENLNLIIHPTVLEGLFVYDLIEIGKKREIPTFFLMNSWDNPSTKALIDGSPDKLFVWGEQTKKHAKDLLGVPDEKIVIAGAAQMQLFKNNVSCNYKALINLDKKYQLICYAGSSRGLDEISQLHLLDEYIASKKLNIKILYKPHPWKNFANPNEKSFFDFKFKNVIMDIFSHKNYLARLNKDNAMDLNSISYENTNIILKSIDGLVTPMSTIMLEATMHGIPVQVYYPKNSDEFLGNFAHDTHRRMFKEFFHRVSIVTSKGPKDFILNFESLLAQIGDKLHNEILVKQSEYFNVSLSKDYIKILKEEINKINE